MIPKSLTAEADEINVLGFVENICSLPSKQLYILFGHTALIAQHRLYHFVNTRCESLSPNPKCLGIMRTDIFDGSGIRRGGCEYEEPDQMESRSCVFVGR
jgi:hypothetical protein